MQTDRRGVMFGLGATLTLPWATPAYTAMPAMTLDLLIAQARAAVAIPVLVHEPHLASVAQTHVSALVRYTLVSHADAQGALPVERGLRAGYGGQVLGDLLAVAPNDDPRLVVNAWLDHDQTRAVLLDPAANHIGLAYIFDRTGQTRWNVVLGAG